MKGVLLNGKPLDIEELEKSSEPDSETKEVYQNTLASMAKAQYRQARLKHYKHTEPNGEVRILSKKEIAQEYGDPVLNTRTEQILYAVATYGPLTVRGIGEGIKWSKTTGALSGTVSALYYKLHKKGIKGLERYKAYDEDSRSNSFFYYIAEDRDWEDMYQTYCSSAIPPGPAPESKSKSALDIQPTVSNPELKPEDTGSNTPLPLRDEGSNTPLPLRGGGSNTPLPLRGGGNITTKKDELPKIEDTEVSAPMSDVSEPLTDKIIQGIFNKLTTNGDHKVKVAVDVSVRVSVKFV